MSNNEFDNFVEFKKKYKELISLVYKNSGEEKLNVFIESVSDEDLELLINNFCKSIENDKKSRKLFLNRNERLFSETSKVKIIPSFNLKKCLSNSKNKDYIWECIQLLYAIYRTGDESKKDLVTRVVEKIEQYNLGTNNLKNDSSGNNVDNMIMDIADTLRNNLVNESKKNSKVNPIENMIKTSQMISQKYGNQLKQGNISMNDMFNSLGRMMEKIDEKTSNDEELKNIDVSEMPKPDELMKDLGLGDLGGEGGANPMDMLSSLMGGKKEESKSKKLTPEQIKEMEEFYKNMDTSDLNKESFEGNIEIVDESNIVDQNPKVGDILNGLNDNSQGGIPDISSMLNSLGSDSDNKTGMPDIGAMLNSLGSESKNGNDLNDKLNEINNNLISQLPKDKQEDIKMMTENMTKIMKTIAKN